MPGIWPVILELVACGDVVVSMHGYDELCEDDLAIREIADGVNEAIIVEEYPDYFKGPCVLVLQRDKKAKPVHVVWGIPAGQMAPAVVVTAYRPEPDRWEDGWLTRRNR
ncbi:MAG: DUF4258 domain-containing protein [Polyangia bacterium]|jgi:hypothetical protein|nr:DUF4258 domain-containing protein [Polyangia bacterium]